MISQNLLAVPEFLIGLFIFLAVVGAVQNFTLRLGPYDVGGLLSAFKSLRDRVLQNVEAVQYQRDLKKEEALGDERRKLQMALAR